LLASWIAIIWNLAVFKNISVSSCYMTLEVVFVFSHVWTIRTLKLWCLATFQSHVSQQIAPPVVHFSTSGAWEGSRPNWWTTVLSISFMIIPDTPAHKAWWWKLITAKFLFYENRL
jgi:hypothetical protein